jgi:DNA helicase II / ATP-dependent DNA helicase PcrA
MSDHPQNPAEQAAAAADARMLECIDQGRSFRLEAGAGAGKTHSLITALQYLIDRRAPQYVKAHKKIACITYTNVAKDEIDSRTDRHPAIYSGTIHSFCWALIKDFQPQLRSGLPNLPNWPERIAESGAIGLRRIEYDLGHPKMDEKQIHLAHDDVLALTVALLPITKFRRLFTDRFPILLIDE